MALTLPIVIPNSSSPVSNDNQLPPTPSDQVESLSLPPSAVDTKDNILPTDGNHTANAQSANNSQLAKRKPSRRANTAERRATHNAVERARRETLNGRFLDLAALLPNLSQIRRPSKSAIVNSSIAHIHASRRHRLLASRELRVLKFETDALRRELNEWRDRAGLPRVEEPVRGEGFAIVCSGEVEVVPAVGMDDGEEGLEDGDDEFVGVQQVDAGPRPGYNGGAGGMPLADDLLVDDIRNPMAAAMLKPNAGPTMPSNNAAHFAHLAQGQQHPHHLANLMPRQSMPHSPTSMIGASPFDNSGGMVPGAFAQNHQQHQSFGGFPANDVEKVVAWNMHMYGFGGNPGNNNNGNGTGLFTPPGTAHGVPSGNGNNNGMGTNNEQAAFFANLQRQQQMHGTHGPMYGSPVEGDDGSSVGSANSHSHSRSRSASVRERSGSFGSGYGSPGSAGSFEMPGGDFAVGGAVPRRMSAWGVGDGMGGMGMGGQMGGMNGMAGMKALAVGGGAGGNGGGFGMMM